MGGVLLPALLQIYRDESDIRVVVVQMHLLAYVCDSDYCVRQTTIKKRDSKERDIHFSFSSLAMLSWMYYDASPSIPFCRTLILLKLLI